MLSKRVVLVLVVIAVILALVTVSYSMINSEKKVSSEIPNVNNVADGVGRVGVTIDSPTIEDKGTG
jgi:hypothetical protein